MNVDVATITISVTITLETKNAIQSNGDGLINASTLVPAKELGAEVGGGLIIHHELIIRTLRYGR